MLCLADRGYVGFDLWRQASASGAALLWRVRRNQVLPCLERLEDGSYLSKLHGGDKARRHDRDGLPVRVVEYRLDGMPDEVEALLSILSDALARVLPGRRRPA